MTATAAATAATLTPQDILARAEKRLRPLIERNGAGDPLVLAVASCYDALHRAATVGLPVRVIAEPTSEDDLALVRVVVDGEGKAL